MHWFRSRSRLGACLALLALAFQLVLAFGHVHLNGAGGQPSSGIETIAGAAAPAGNGAPDVADHHCAVCALIHLAGTLLPPEPVALPLPIRPGQWRCPDTVPCFVLPGSFPAPFSARAPPLA